MKQIIIEYNKIEIGGPCTMKIFDKPEHGYISNIKANRSCFEHSTLHESIDVTFCFLDQEFTIGNVKKDKNEQVGT